MDSFLLCLVLVTGIAMGGRDQWLVAQLSDAFAKGPGDPRRPLPVLVLASASAALTAAAMAYAGASLAALLPQRAAEMLIAFALAIAAFELAWPVRVKPIREPTRNGVAVVIVLVWRQFGDAARFIVFAFAAEALYPLTAFLGGALGGSVAVALGWWLGAVGLTRFPLRGWRLALAALTIVAAIFIGLNARYAIY
ncbi:MAG: hypothetical protein V2I27_08655 [Erythrobacter sp.]|jgi:putative Ca2+/H+ antiporter (TMEM165/GDT1 family)|nr:hypothetical protein [Erythrobacter sp.]